VQSIVIERPSELLDLSEFFNGYGEFPGNLYVIQPTEGKYAANNVTLKDGTVTNGLATFPTTDDATTYMASLNGMGGKIVRKTFDEARQIAIDRPALTCILLFKNAEIVDFVFVR
jgi:hypothetical protein